MPHVRTCARGHTWDALTGDTSDDLDCPYCAASRDVPLADSATAVVSVPAAPRGLPEPRGMPAVPGYELVEELGRGGMGVVYKARQVGLNRLVALKMIRAGAGAGSGERARFRAEAEAIARLRHPHIVQVYEIGEADSQPYLALEYLEGGNLARNLADAALPPRRAAELTQLLARAVHDTHRAGVVHRDLKPANVLLAADGTPKIADFGLARLLDRDSNLTQSGAPLGTPAYMAPEQAGGRTESVGPAADVYALGAVLYKMLTGRPPFRGPSPLDTLDQVRNRDPVAPGQLQPGIPRDLETICLKCLRKDPARRYASAGELADDCAAFLQGKPIRARPAGPVERAVKWARRRPWVAGLSALVILLVAGAVVGGLIYQNRLRAALDAADRQRDRAEANFQKIQEAVDGLLVEVGDKDLAEVPEMEEARARLLERALQLFESLLDDRDSSDPAVRRQVCRTLRRTSDIYQMLGRLPEAERDAARGLAMAEQLAAEFPDELGDRKERAWAAYRVAGVLAARERPAEAVGAFGRAMALAEELPADTPDRHSVVARSCNELGNLHKRDRPAEAEAYYRRALALLADPATSVPGDATGLRAGLHINLGVLAQTQGRDALPAYREAQAILEPAVAAARRVGNSHALLADVYHNLGILTGAKDARAAEDYLSKALDWHKQLLARNPRVTKRRRDVAADHEALAALCIGTNRPELAVKHLTEAVGVRGELVGETVETPDDAARLANDYVTLGMLHAQQKRRGEAAAFYKKAVGVLEPLRRRQPEVVAYAAGMGTALLFLAYLHTEAEEWAESLSCCDRSVELLEAAYARTPGDVATRVKLQTVHLLRAEVLRHLGRGVAALADLVRAKQLEAPK